MSQPIFSGDGHCPRCSAFVFLEWQMSQTQWQCQSCSHSLDINDTISMVSSYRPERNSGDLEEMNRRIQNNLGLTPVPPAAEPARQQSWIDCDGRWPEGEHPLRNFFRPKVFAKNLLVGLAMTAAWRLFGVALDVHSLIREESRPR